MDEETKSCIKEAVTGEAEDGETESARDGKGRGGEEKIIGK
jgi:hypothetical protein